MIAGLRRARVLRKQGRLLRFTAQAHWHNLLRNGSSRDWLDLSTTARNHWQEVIVSAHVNLLSKNKSIRLMVPPKENIHEIISRLRGSEEILRESIVQDEISLSRAKNQDLIETIQNRINRTHNAKSILEGVIERLVPDSWK
jgi:hypothetical protein